MILKALETQGFAKHSGLKFRFDEQKRFVQTIESGLSAAGIQYEFWVQLGILQKLDLALNFAELVQKARQSIETSA